MMVVFMEPTAVHGQLYGTFSSNIFFSASSLKRGLAHKNTADLLVSTDKARRGTFKRQHQKQWDADHFRDVQRNSSTQSRERVFFFKPYTVILSFSGFEPFLHHLTLSRRYYHSVNEYEEGHWERAEGGEIQDTLSRGSERATRSPLWEQFHEPEDQHERKPWLWPKS